MTTYLWSGQDRHGQRVVLRIQAGSAEQARNELESQGYTELTLHSDEIVDAVIRNVPAVQSLSAERQLEYRNRGRGTWGEILNRAVRKDWALSMGLLALFALGLYRGNPWLVVPIAVLMVGLVALRVEAGLPVIYYSRLNNAAEWHRWPEALLWVTKLEKRAARGRTSVDAPELARQKARALAGSGKLAEALALFSQETVRAAWPEWLYLSLLAGIHDTAKDFDRAIALNREALSVSGVHPSLLVDLAFRLAFRKRDFSAARSAIEEAEKRDLVDLAKPFLSRCRGLISEGEGDLDEARKHLEDALRGLTAFSRLDLMEGNILLTEAFLCCVCARLGDADSARGHLLRSRDFLRAAGEEELLRRCDKSIDECCG